MNRYCVGRWWVSLTGCLSWSSRHSLIQSLLCKTTAQMGLKKYWFWAQKVHTREFLRISVSKRILKPPLYHRDCIAFVFIQFGEYHSDICDLERYLSLNKPHCCFVPLSSVGISLCWPIRKVEHNYVTRRNSPWFHLIRFISRVVEC